MLSGNRYISLLTHDTCLTGLGLFRDHKLQTDTRRSSSAKFVHHTNRRHQTGCPRRTFTKLVTANASFTRRDAITTASGILLCGACGPALALDSSTNVVSKGKGVAVVRLNARLASNITDFYVSTRKRGLGCKFDSSG